MILIADSGATKTDWRIIQGASVIDQQVTSGISPIYQSSAQIEEQLVKDQKNKTLPKDVEKIWFYGSGCISLEKNNVVKTALENAFGTNLIEVASDMLGAARSVCGHEKGIAGILGTGSGSCLFDGVNIIDQVPSLGYILGDEGSGAFMGKILIASFLRNELPDDLKKSFLKRFNLDKEKVLNHLNDEEYPSRFLASFGKFLMHHVSHPFIYQLIKSSFDQFVNKYILAYEGHDKLKISFTGSIAYYFSNILQRVLKQYNLEFGQVVESPIAGLTLYHIKME